MFYPVSDHSQGERLRRSGSFFNGGAVGQNTGQLDRKPAPVGFALYFQLQLYGGSLLPVASG